MTFTVKERETFRKLVKKFIVKNPTKKKSEIIAHFVQQGIPRSTLYRLVKRLDTNQSTKDLKRFGRPSKWTTEKLKKLKRLTNNKNGVSLRKLGNVFSVDHKTISYNLKKMNIKYRKKMKTPKYTAKKAAKSKKLCRKLVNYIYKTKEIIIIDDEKYFGLSCVDIPGNSGFYTDNIEKCPDDVRFKGIEKFSTKVLVWLAISERGISAPLILSSKSVSINQNVYLNDCLKKRLLPFIQDKHSDGNYLFWPDLASAHYAGSCVSWMEDNINFVAKNMNPPNVPQARPIENFWGDLTQKVYEGGWEAKNKNQLIRRIRKTLKEYDMNDLQNHMKGIKTKLRKIADNGVLASFKK